MMRDGTELLWFFVDITILRSVKRRERALCMVTEFGVMYVCRCKDMIMNVAR